MSFVPEADRFENFFDALPLPGRGSREPRLPQTLRVAGKRQEHVFKDCVLDIEPRVVWNLRPIPSRLI